MRVLERLCLDEIGHLNEHWCLSINCLWEVERGKESRNEQTSPMVFNDTNIPIGETSILQTTAVEQENWVKDEK